MRRTCAHFFYVFYDYAYSKLSCNFTFNLRNRLCTQSSGTAAVEKTTINTHNDYTNNRGWPRAVATKRRAGFHRSAANDHSLRHNCAIQTSYRIALTVALTLTPSDRTMRVSAVSQWSLIVCSARPRVSLRSGDVQMFSHSRRRDYMPAYEQRAFASNVQRAAVRVSAAYRAVTAIDWRGSRATLDPTISPTFAHLDRPFVSSPVSTNDRCERGERGKLITASEPAVSHAIAAPALDIEIT